MKAQLRYTWIWLIRSHHSLLVADRRPSVGDSGSSMAKRTIVPTELRRLRLLLSGPVLSPSIAARSLVAKGVNRGVAGVVDI